MNTHIFSPLFSSLAEAYTTRLKTDVLCSKPFLLMPDNNFAAISDSLSNHPVDLYKQLEMMYQYTCNYFSSDSPDSMLREAVKYYTQLLNQPFLCTLKPLKKLCQMKQQEAVYVEIYSLLYNCKTYFLTEFSKEFEANKGYYILPQLNNFLQKIPVETSQIHTAYFYQILQEIEGIANEKRIVFYRQIHPFYEQYVKEITACIHLLDNNLPTAFYGESIPTYLKRIVQTA
ncbi:MAG: hypothetical protein J6A75_06200 [Lachnospiraceae bacterium]|nr:hypothetical protein [Lachnospiraceae bacterium]